MESKCKCKNEYCEIVTRFLQHVESSRLPITTTPLCGYKTIHYPTILLTDRPESKRSSEGPTLSCHEAIQVIVTLKYTGKINTTNDEVNT